MRSWHPNCQHNTNTFSQTHQKTVWEARMEILDQSIGFEFSDPHHRHEHFVHPVQNGFWDGWSRTTPHMRVLWISLVCINMLTVHRTVKTGCWHNFCAVCRRSRWDCTHWILMQMRTKDHGLCKRSAHALSRVRHRRLSAREHSWRSDHWGIFVRARMWTISEQKNPICGKWIVRKKSVQKYLQHTCGSGILWVDWDMNICTLRGNLRTEK